MTEPSRTTPVIDETTLPGALQQEHCTKPGVWGLIRVLEGGLRLHCPDDGSVKLLTPERPGVVAPEQPHHVELIGRMRMRVEFYTAPPPLQSVCGASASAS